MPKAKRKSSYPDYSTAKAQAIDLQLESSSKYRDYIKKNKIKYLPAYPERVYKDWISWNDYLGTNNKFMGESKKVVRPWWDAVKWAQEFCTLHNMDTGDQWLAWVKDHKEELPSDIPAHPDSKYPEWDGWKTWLGTDVRGRLAAAKASTALLCICSKHSLHVPGNVFQVIQAERGMSELRSMLVRDQELRVVRCYRMDNDYKEEVMRVVSSHMSRESADGSIAYDGWYCSNVNGLLMDLDLMLVPYRGEK